MPGKSVHAPGLFSESLGDAWVWLLQGHTVEFIILAMILSTVCARIFGGSGRY